MTLVVTVSNPVGSPYVAEVHYASPATDAQPLLKFPETKKELQAGESSEFTIYKERVIVVSER